MREQIRTAASRKILFTRHALDQMNKPDRMISEGDVKTVIFEGEVIEEYPADSRGASALMLGIVAGRPVHVVCAPKGDYLAIVTAYIPTAEEWERGFKQRRR